MEHVSALAVILEEYDQVSLDDEGARREFATKVAQSVDASPRVKRAISTVLDALDADALTGTQLQGVAAALAIFKQVVDGNHEEQHAD